MPIPSSRTYTSDSAVNKPSRLGPKIAEMDLNMPMTTKAYTIGEIQPVMAENRVFSTALNPFSRFCAGAVFFGAFVSKPPSFINS